jgi:transcriptional regulatory protein LevR
MNKIWMRQYSSSVKINTDSGAKIRVYCRCITASYLALIIRNLSKYKKISIIKIVIVGFIIVFKHTLYSTRLC